MQIFQLDMAVKLIKQLMTTFLSTFFLSCCINSKHKSNQSAMLQQMLKMSAICVYTSSQTLPEIRDCRLRLVVTRPRSSQALTSVPGYPSVVV